VNYPVDLSQQEINRSCKRDADNQNQQFILGIAQRGLQTQPAFNLTRYIGDFWFQLNETRHEGQTIQNNWSQKAGIDQPHIESVWITPFVAEYQPEIVKLHMNDQVDSSQQEINRSRKRDADNQN
jgi:hypothetical protein